MRTTAFLLTAVVLFASASRPQVRYETGTPHIRNYSPREYDAHNQNWVIAQDSLDVLFVGNTNGILHYDGLTWQLLQVRNHSVVRSLGRSADGRIYVGAKGEIGYLKRDRVGQVVYQSLMTDLFPKDLKFSDVWSVEATTSGIFFSTTRSVIRCRNDSFYVWQTQTEFDVGRAVDDRFFIREEGKGLLEAVGDSLVPVAGSEEIGRERIYFMTEWRKGAMLIGTRTRGILEFDGAVVRPFAPAWSSFLVDARVYNAQRLKDGSLALATLRKGIVVVDSLGSLKLWLTNRSGLADLNVRHVFEDRRGFLWAAMNNGLACIDWVSGVTVFDDRHNLTGSVRDVQRYRDNLYVSTNQGVFLLEEAKDDPRARFRPVEGIRNQAWSFLSTDDRLFSCTNDGLYEITDAGSRRLNNLDGYQCVRLKRDSSILLVALRNGVGVLRMTGRNLQHLGNLRGISMDTREILEDEDGSVWLYTAGEGVARISWSGAVDLNPTIERFDTTHGLPAGWATAISMGGAVRFGTPDGFFYYDGRGRFARDTTFNSALNIDHSNVFLMTEQDANRVWARVAKRLGYFERTASGWTWNESALNGFRQSPVYHVSSEPGGSTWFGTSDGLLRYEQRPVDPARIPMGAFIRRVLIGTDSLVASDAGSDAMLGEFPFFAASIRFEFCGSPNSLERESGFQYKLNGFDGSWSTWSGERVKEYTNLPEGNYAFAVRARDVFGAVGETWVNFSITPPWYRTWSAYFGFVAGAMLSVVFIVRWSVASYRRRQAVLEQKIVERTAELKAKNDELESTLAKLQAAQNQMVQSEKLMALGNLIAGVAHEINNPVTFIYSNISHLRQYIAELRDLLAEAEKLHSADAKSAFATLKEGRDFDFVTRDLDKLVKSYENGAERIAQIVGNLRRFSRSSELQTRDVDLRESISDTLAILTPQFKFNIDVRADIRDLPMIECNAGEIQQVFMNVLANAAYAVEIRNKSESRPKGHITVEADVIEMAGSSGWVKFAITDDGTGMSSDVQKRIFDPFFTTKPVGQGTGLGLSISHSIIEKHGGKLYFESREGEGTVFYIELPLRQQEPS